MLIMRSARSPATWNRFFSSPSASIIILGPSAVPSLRSDSIIRNEVGNHTGPRQFELPPLIFATASPGS